MSWFILIDLVTRLYNTPLLYSTDNTRFGWLKQTLLSMLIALFSFKCLKLIHHAKLADDVEEQSVLNNKQPTFSSVKITWNTAAVKNTGQDLVRHLYLRSLSSEECLLYCWPACSPAWSVLIVGGTFTRYTYVLHCVQVLDNWRINYAS